MAPKSDAPLSVLDRARGCLLGGAVGDALGAPVEFLSTAEIRTAFDASGIREFAPAYGRLGAITDDTQMTLFTAEGLLRACRQALERGSSDLPSVVHHALLRWLLTQGEHSAELREPPDGWLIENSELFSRRAPGVTCLSALQATRYFGEAAANDSKGCGALMRIAPIGVYLGAEENTPLVEAASRAYELGCASAKSTHGHADSTHSAGYFAALVAYLMRGSPVSEAIAQAKRPLFSQTGADRVLDAIEGAERLARSELAATPETLETLGAGWVAEEALAISVFCALRAPSFEQGVRLAVNHSGDSDSTGSLTGQLLGTADGVGAVPARWLRALELSTVIDAVASDLARAANGEPPSAARYPGW